jgi:hypothetical protein
MRPTLSSGETRDGLCELMERPRVSRSLSSGGASRRPVGSARATRFFLIFRISLDRIKTSEYTNYRPVPQRGGSRSSQDAGRDAVDADGAIDEQRSRRTAKSCGPDTPTLVSSWRSYPLTTVARKPGRRGEHEGNRKTIARGMPGDSGVTVVTVTAGAAVFLPARLRAHRAPGIPCALTFEGKAFSANLARNTRRDRGAVAV